MGIGPGAARVNGMVRGAAAIEAHPAAWHTARKTPEGPMTDFAERRRIMVDTQIRPSDVPRFPVIDAFLRIPREAFVPDGRQEAAYVEENLPIAPGRVMLEPRTLAKLVDALALGPEDLVLDVGSGLGYSAAILSRLAGTVVALESDDEMAREAEAALTRHGLDNAALVTGPLAEGAARHGPYDAILIQGGVETLPDAIADQLAEDGRIGAVFMDGALGEARIGRKHGGRIAWRLAFNATAPVLEGFEAARAFTL